jgi:hypothetical protein
MEKPTRRKFTREDDEALLAAHDSLSPATWDTIAEALGGKWSARQIRERYNAYLNPRLNHEWTQADDHQLVSLHNQYGARWAVIAAKLRNRSNVLVRNRYRSLQKQGKLPLLDTAPADEIEDSGDFDGDWEVED